MSESQKSLLEFLEQLRRERDELDILIKGVEKRLGIVTDAHASDLSVTPKIAVPIDSIPVGFFHNLTQADAAEKLLRLNAGHPLTTPEIVDVLRRSGMILNSKNAVTIMYTTLNRNPKFERVADKAWGLSEWYPDKRKKKEMPVEWETLPKKQVEY